MPSMPSSAPANPFPNTGLTTYPGMIADTDGTPYGYKMAGGKPRVSVMPYTYDIAEGNVADHDPIRFFGHNPSVGTAWETVFEGSELRYYLTNGEQLQVTSGDSDDTVAGIGARTVVVSGLDSDYAPLNETVSLNGTANVTTTASFLRVNGFYTATAGTTGYNIGELTVSNNSDSDLIASMEIQDNNALAACYTVPAGKTAFIVQALATEASTKGSEFGFWVRLFGSLWRMMRTIVLLDSSIVVPSPMCMLLPEKTDVEIRTKALIAGANVTAGFEGWIE